MSHTPRKPKYQILQYKRNNWITSNFVVKYGIDVVVKDEWGFKETFHCCDGDDPLLFA